jgi:hypothetical protein
MAREKQHKATGGSLVIDWESLPARFHNSGKNGKSNGVQSGSPINGADNGKRPTKSLDVGRYQEEPQHAV